MICGRDWQPLSIERVIETFATSTRVAKISTDAGPAFLKGMGNPSGDGALASELVAGELAALIGLRVPPFAIASISDMDIPMIGYGPMTRGPAFASKEIDGFVADGTDTPLKRLADRDAVGRLVMFDTWIRNHDRVPPVGSYHEPNRDNLFFTPEGRKLQLVALDHSHCFVEGALEDQLLDPLSTSDDRVFGNFPEFSGYISERGVLGVASALRRIAVAEVRNIVFSVPVEWGPSRARREDWVGVICERAQRVARDAPDQILQQVRLDLQGG